ncbi:hypothetical protein AV530_013916 [Patagioenas fasciata monilis]|uniref:Uncharacterized protein n=1 Tax=Patagioenas fasciata monilis TaxID=372326 RepID=A0A1V4KN20_PATFA|nr:hypothetical protein AV530_013916 [Patagioenas fasciata monilis]
MKVWLGFLEPCNVVSLHSPVASFQSTTSASKPVEALEFLILLCAEANIYHINRLTTTRYTFCADARQQ